MSPVDKTVFRHADMLTCRQLCLRGLLNESARYGFFIYTNASWDVLKSFSPLELQQDTRPVVAEEIS